MTCEQCGNGFSRKPHARHDQRFCSTHCRQAAWLKHKYAGDPVFAEAKREQVRQRFSRLDGLDYAKRMLQMRRAGALHRRRQRSLGATRAPRG